MMQTCLSKYFVALLSALFFFNVASAQKPSTGKHDNLYSAGYASAFIGGLYDVYFPYKQILAHGDFGLGAPEHLDGELLIFKGVPYQTRYTGKTTVVDVTGTAPYAISCFFKADKVIKPERTLNKTDFYKFLDSITTNQNGMYAIHVSGNFSYVKTRAFPAAEKPYQPLAALLANQHFFEFNNVKGDLVGFKLGEFAQGPFIAGYHFHFLQDNKVGGGHIVDLTVSDVVVEIDELTSYSMDLQQTQGFKEFDFTKDRKDEIKSVENGKKD
ncbi:MAG: acetolactate decarboxylase [Sphingobacteriaceae bacterium]|nr:MAG: acetolactate decarboxylase [Sphingobacteriaceae bacterium]